MKLIKETGRRGGRYHTRYWDMGSRWEMCARKWGSYYIWEIYRWGDECRRWTTENEVFYSKAEALAFHKAAA